ncbi:MAG: hypothetical protein UIG59_05625 [Acutalibacteraceae bacterium]|nr:hypothetical protein [Acutalibacteraceae bacterium]
MRYKLFGVSVEISYYFLCAVCISIALDKSGLFAITLLSSALHEMGHLVFIVIFNGRIRSIRFTLGCLGIEYHDNFSKSEEVISLLAGPFTNLILGLISKLLGFNTFCVINMVLGIYNLLPVCGLDGGLIIIKILENKVDNRIVTIILDFLTISVAIGFILLFFVGIWHNSVNLSLILFSLYLILPVVLKKLVER